MKLGAAVLAGWREVPLDQDCIIVSNNALIIGALIAKPSMARSVL